jgi:VanZ family protein
MNNFTRFQLPLILWMFFIFLISSVESIPHMQTIFISTDKLAHTIEFFVFCWFCWRAMYFQDTFSLLKRWSLFFAFIFTCIFGYLDEVHQLFVPGRSYEYLDMLADATGALLCIVIITFMKRRMDRKALTS